MFNPNKTNRILLYQACAFLLIIVLSWLDELVDLPARLFGAHGWRESAMETFVVLAVWIPSFGLTRRLLARLFYLEGFLRVCAWCRRIGHNDTWIPLEQYFAQGLNIKTSHGICPDCAKRHFPNTSQADGSEAAEPKADS